MGSEDSGDRLGRQPKQTHTDFEEIHAFDKAFRAITSGLPVRTGSLFRVGSESLHLWRVEVTKENRSQIKWKADEINRKDFEEIENDATIESIEATTFITLVRNSMVRNMVHFATEVLKSVDDGKKEFHVCELAPGFGQTSVSLAVSLLGNANLLRRTHFHLIDYSRDKLARAEERLDGYKPASIDAIAMKDDDYLATTGHTFDIVLSRGHFHRKPFLKDTLEAIRSKLTGKGVLISSDWHSSLPNHPSFVYELLERMGLDGARLRLFKGMFDITNAPELSPEEQHGMEEHQEYWAEVYREILASPSTSGRKSKHYLLGAHDTTEKRVQKLEEAEFIVDPAKIRMAFPTSKLGRNPIKMMTDSDRASVIMAMKGK